MTLDLVDTLEASEGGGVHLLRADEIRPERVEYLDEPTIPLRVVTIVTGVDGVGKSTILYDRAARATRGQLPGAFLGRPVDAVIASSEDHPGSVIVPRLIAAGADLARVHIVRVHRDGLTGDIALPEDLDDVATAVIAVEARLLIIDPLVAHLPLAVDTHKAQHVRSVLAPLARLAEEAVLSVAAVVHFNGAASTDVRSRISGSKALRDASRSVLVCGTDPNDETRYVVVQDKNSFGPRSSTGAGYRLEPAEVTVDGEPFPTSRVVWLGPVDIDARGLLAAPDDPDVRTARDDAADFLKAALADGPVDAAALKAHARDDGIAERTLHRARRELGVKVDRRGPQGRSRWSLPAVVPPVVPHENDGTTGIGGTTHTDMPPVPDVPVTPGGTTDGTTP